MIAQIQPIPLRSVVAPRVTAQTVSRKSSRKWHCRVEETLMGNFFVVPLISMEMLKSESYWMNSWCESYGAACANGRNAIFSLRSRCGERLATLVLENHDGTWDLEKCVGSGDLEVLEEVRSYLDEEGILQTEWYGTELYYLAYEVIKLMNRSDCCH